MKIRLGLENYCAVACLAVLLSASGPVIAESQSVEKVVVEESPVTDAEKGALSLSGPAKEDREPIYAGTSMWFLLSIAALGSIAVKRRVEAPD